jgi:PEP-CTERM motif-containing protein
MSMLNSKVRTAAMKPCLFMAFVVLASTARAQLTFIGQTNSVTVNTSHGGGSTTNSNSIGDFTAQLADNTGNYPDPSASASLTVNTDSGTLSVQGDAGVTAYFSAGSAGSFLNSVFTLQTAQTFAILTTVSQYYANEDEDSIVTESLSDNNNNALWTLSNEGAVSTNVSQTVFLNPGTYQITVQDSVSAANIAADNTYSFSFAPVPEPSTLALLAGALSCLLVVQRRKLKRLERVA